jgi:ribokinase
VGARWLRPDDQKSGWTSVNRVLVAGSYNHCTTVVCDSLPKPGQTVLGHEMFVEPGGKGSNQAIAAARLGAHVTFLVRLGRDAAGEEAIVLFEREGLTLVESERSLRAGTGAAFIMSDKDGENLIAVAPGANSELSSSDAPKGIVESCDVLLCQLECPEEVFVGLAQRAQASGVLTILNPAPARELSSYAYQLATIITPNESELEVLAGHPIGSEHEMRAAVDQIHDRGTPNVVVTLGSKGAFWSSEMGSGYVKAPKVRAIDTTGAGDAFNAGLAVALAAGLTLPDAVSQAVLSGSYCATKRGVIDGLARVEQLDREDQWLEASDN